MFISGEQPGIGSYECTKCGEVVILKKKEDTLSQCIRCRNEDWDKKANV